MEGDLYSPVSLGEQLKLFSMQFLNPLGDEEEEEE